VVRPPPDDEPSPPDDELPVLDEVPPPFELEPLPVPPLVALVPSVPFELVEPLELGSDPDGVVLELLPELPSEPTEVPREPSPELPAGVLEAPENPPGSDPALTGPPALDWLEPLVPLPPCELGLEVFPGRRALVPPGAGLPVPSPVGWATV